MLPTDETVIKIMLAIIVLAAFSIFIWLVVIAIKNAYKIASYESEFKQKAKEEEESRREREQDTLLFGLYTGGNHQPGRDYKDFADTEIMR